MKKWKTLFFFSFVLLVVSNLFWIYTSLDAGVTQTYRNDSIEKQEKVINLLGEMVVEGSKKYSQQELLFLLRQKYPDGFIVEQENEVIYQGVHFEFENDSLVSVTENW